ncbi:MAG: translation elongation factor Ts [Lachnospiraceae bacterium]|nr:translation elongation factor Ts [Lachnospiraceae bacterium]
MAAITASMVKELREATGAGMMECKKALTETDGNFDAAVEVLKKSGAAKMEKKASRIAAEGICRVAVDGNKAVVVEVNSETDFVAKNEVFQEFVQDIANTALASGKNGGKDGEDVQALLDGGLTEVFAEKTLKIGEKLSFRRFMVVSADSVATYIHGGGRIGVLVAADGAQGEKIQEALANVAMQIAAMNPQYISRDDISEDELAKIREITIDSSLNAPDTLPKPIMQRLIDKAIADKVWSDADIAIYEEKKADKSFNMNFLFNFLSDAAKAGLAGLAMDDKANIVADKIFAGLAEGRVTKQMKEICLLDQTYVRAEDGKQTVAAYLKSVDANLVIKKAVRFEVGEGMQKKSENFAEEVAAQLG